MILIADSGSTKTEWCLLRSDAGHLHSYTAGLNPFFQTPQEQTEEITKRLLPWIEENSHEHGTSGRDEAVDAVYFYGAGCTPEKIPVVRQVLQDVFPNASVSVFSDMVAVAHALCGRSAGIACILGTGSNSCFYDGREICSNVSPLGFILGDEGSGAVLGRLLVGDVLKNQTSAELRERFFRRFSLTPAEIIERVYRKPFPNRFLASLSPFLAENLHEPEIYRLVYDSFSAFLRRNVMQYDYTRYPIHFSGSVAYYYQDVLRRAASDLHLQVGEIARGPMEGLIGYYSVEGCGEVKSD